MKKLRLILLGAAGIWLAAGNVAAQSIPKVSVEIGEVTSPTDLSTTLQIVILLTVLALAPSLLIMVTSFIRITVVMAFLRHAMGSNQMPPSQLLMGLSLILTFFIMTPVAERAYNDGIKPYMDEQISGEEAYDVLVPAFVISELRTAFQIAFVIFIPFLVIDMVVASVLMSMGMMMLPPVIVSLPFKILLFVLVDGWYLLVKSLVESFHM